MIFMEMIEYDTKKNSSTYITLSFVKTPIRLRNNLKLELNSKYYDGYRHLLNNEIFWTTHATDFTLITSQIIRHLACRNNEAWNDIC